MKHRPLPGRAPAARPGPAYCLVGMCRHCNRIVRTAPLPPPEKLLSLHVYALQWTDLSGRTHCGANLPHLPPQAGDRAPQIRRALRLEVTIRRLVLSLVPAVVILAVMVPFGVTWWIRLGMLFGLFVAIKVPWIGARTQRAAARPRPRRWWPRVRVSVDPGRLATLVLLTLLVFGGMTVTVRAFLFAGIIVLNVIDVTLAALGESRRT
ncbi:MAG: hypothetical protein J2P26_04875 [Nocardiopsaceae bacterium]|nr:hypothetical protein [Nocardiopsaceae bacterium]